ncbi:hypothetical protein QUC31_009105 [Theobroma cacao]
MPSLFSNSKLTLTATSSPTGATTPVPPRGMASFAFHKTINLTPITRNIEKTGNQVASDDEPGKSGTDEKPVTALGPTVDAKSDNGTSSKSNTRNRNEDESNNSYGTSGNPSGSSTGRI